MNRLENKVAIITGGASGIGAETAKVFASENARVMITDINEKKLQQVTEQIKLSGGQASYYVLDVTSEDSWMAAVSETLKLYGKIDILFNNAGITVKLRSWDQIPYSEFKNIIDVDLNSQFLGIRAVSTAMIASGGGSIINMSSTAGLVAAQSAHPGYIAAKGGARLLAKAASRDYALKNIRVNSIHPGLIRTELTAPFLDTPEALQMLKSINPMQRAGNALEVAKAVLFLASDDSSFVTGTELVVDGGQVNF